MVERKRKKKKIVERCRRTYWWVGLMVLTLFVGFQLMEYVFSIPFEKAKKGVHKKTNRFWFCAQTPRECVCKRTRSKKKTVTPKTPRICFLLFLWQPTRAVLELHKLHIIHFSTDKAKPKSLLFTHFFLFKNIISALFF